MEPDLKFWNLAKVTILMRDGEKLQAPSGTLYFNVANDPILVRIKQADDNVVEIPYADVSRIFHA